MIDYDINSMYSLLIRDYTLLQEFSKALNIPLTVSIQKPREEFIKKEEMEL